MVKRILIAILLIAVVSVSILFIIPNKKMSEKPVAAELKKQIPIIAIHGTGGDTHTFDESKQSLLDDNSIQGELAIVVTENGSLKYSGSLNIAAKHPFISIAFTDNTADPKIWAPGLKKALISLEKLYHFEKIDAIGYSNGGLALVDYLEKYAGESNLPKMRRLITLGAPFNGTEMAENKDAIDFQDVSDKTPELKNYLQFKQKIPQSLEVLSVGSNIVDHLSDGIVPLESAFSSRLIFTKQKYRELTLTNSKAEHGNLPNVPETANLIKQFFVQSQYIQNVQLK